MISDSLLDKFDGLTRKYPVKRSALIPMLLATQEELGYVTQQAVQFISDYLQVPEVEVQEVITFYTMLRSSPVGKYHLQVCTNISCLLLGAEELFEHISKKLEIRGGEITQDKLFSLVEVECLGACSSAPAMQINYDYHENLSHEKIDGILEELKRQG
jgi:NADH-quinone oxidoreductase subunit E